MNLKRRLSIKFERPQKLLTNFVYYVRRGYSPGIAWNIAERTL